MKKLIYSFRSQTTFLLLSCCGIFSSCDVLHEDEIDNDQPDIASAIYVLPDASTVFDLPSRIKSTSPLTVNISSEPRNGSLSLLEEGLYSYTPQTAADDSFEVLMTNDKGESSARKIQLVSLPRSNTESFCGSIARDDIFTTITSAAVDLDVVANDVIGDCSTGVELTIFAAPFGGTAEVVNGKIRYRAGENFAQRDKFFYQLVSLAGDGQRSAATFGRVVLTSRPPCTIDLRDDELSFDLSAIGSVVKIAADDNDVLCEVNTHITTELTQQPTRGSLVWMPESNSSFTPSARFVYELPSDVSQPFSEHFTYKICIDGTCEEATVTLNFTGSRPSCRVQCQADNYSIVGSSQSEFRFPVLENDELCGESIVSASVVLWMLEEESHEVPGGDNDTYSRQFARIENNVLYYKPAVTSPNLEFDELVYEVITSTGKVSRAKVKIKKR